MKYIKKFENEKNPKYNEGDYVYSKDVGNKCKIIKKYYSIEKNYKYILKNTNNDTEYMTEEYLITNYNTQIEHDALKYKI
jgi:hypothetical protein